MVIHCFNLDNMMQCVAALVREGCGFQANCETFIIVLTGGF